MQISMRNWLSEIVEAGRFEFAEDIHVTAFDERWRNPSTWENAIVSCLKAADEWLADHHQRFEAAVGWPLCRVVQLTDLRDDPLAQLVSLHDNEAPSLCVFETEKRPWTSLVSILGGSCSVFDTRGIRIHLCDWWDRHENAQRGQVWIAHSPKPGTGAS